MTSGKGGSFKRTENPASVFLLPSSLTLTSEYLAFPVSHKKEYKTI